MEGRLNSSFPDSVNGNAWEIVFNMYEGAYHNDEDMLFVLATIKRAIIIDDSNLALNLNPVKFGKYLKTRGVEITPKIKSIWNIAMDECKSLPKVNTPYWQDNELANQVTSFLSKFSF